MQISHYYTYTNKHYYKYDYCDYYFLFFLNHVIYNIPITVDTRISVVPTFRTPSPFVSLFINTPLSNTFFLDTLFQM